MEILINGHNMEVTDRLRGYVEKKVGRLDRYMPNLSEVRVDLREESTRSADARQSAQVTIQNERGTILRAEERSSDMFASIDATVDKLYRQINRYRGKQRKRRRSNVDEFQDFEPVPLAEEEFYDEPEEQRIVRRKRFLLQPMSPDEAIDQMELLGHDFFVFFSAEEEAVNVVYRRHDGDYGLLLPELY